MRIVIEVFVVSIYIVVHKHTKLLWRREEVKRSRERAHAITVMFDVVKIAYNTWTRASPPPSFKAKQIKETVEVAYKVKEQFNNRI